MKPEPRELSAERLANDQYIKPIAERARELAERELRVFSADGSLEELAAQMKEGCRLLAELAEKLEPAEVREKK